MESLAADGSAAPGSAVALPIGLTRRAAAFGQEPFQVSLADPARPTEPDDGDPAPRGELPPEGDGRAGLLGRFLQGKQPVHSGVLLRKGQPSGPTCRAPAGTRVKASISAG